LSQPSSHSELFTLWTHVCKNVWDLEPEAPYSIHDTPLKLMASVVYRESNSDYMWYMGPWDDGDFNPPSYADGVCSRLADAQMEAEKAYLEYRAKNPAPPPPKQYESFDSWYYEQEGHGLRSTRAITELLIGAPEQIRQWLEAAFKAGRDV
jgi:hypothetical protein